jgi:DNA-binding NarL/FixJ family response regulator
MYEEYEYINRSVRAGAEGYLLKKVASSELVNAIRKVYGGEKVFSPQVLETIVATIKEEPAASQASMPIRTLTSREYDVLSLMSEGMSNKEIASKLFVSPKTVEKVVTGIFRKLGVGSRTAAVKLFVSSQ